MNFLKQLIKFEKILIYKKNKFRMTKYLNLQLYFVSKIYSYKIVARIFDYRIETSKYLNKISIAFSKRA